MIKTNSKLLETLIVQAEQLIDIKEDAFNRINKLEDLIENEKTNYQDYLDREESLLEELKIEIKEIKDFNLGEAFEFNDLNKTIQFIQKKLSDLNLDDQFEDEKSKDNIIEIKHHKTEDEVEDEVIIQSIEFSDVKKLVDEILSSLTPWEEAMIKFQFGLFDKEKYPDLNPSSILLPGQSWNYKTCFRYQRAVKKFYEPAFEIPIWSYDTTIKYLNRGFRKLKHPIRSKRLRPCIRYAESLYAKNNIDLEINLTRGYSRTIDELNNFYYPLIFAIFSTRY